jgi:hypothetical protein
MKLLSLGLGIIFILNVFLSPGLILAQDNEESTESAEMVDVYALFWPIVPGKTVADSMFWAKQLKESMGEIFSFGDINKSKYQIELSEKRLVEANKLLDDKDYPNAQKSLQMNKSNRDKSLELMKKAQEEKRKVDELKSRLVTSLENQQKVLEYKLTQLSSEEKSKVEKIVKELTLQISEAR